jgi:hypothetical protein
MPARTRVLPQLIRLRAPLLFLPPLKLRGTLTAFYPLLRLIFRTLCMGCPPLPLFHLCLGLPCLSPFPYLLLLLPLKRYSGEKPKQLTAERMIIPPYLHFPF